MAEDKHNVFVYGTLMRGQKAHCFLEAVEFLGEFVLEGYAIYDLGRYPGIRELPGSRTYGEAYRVDESLIREMDAYEDEGSLYFRRVLEVCGARGTIPAFVYVYAHDVAGEPIPGGRWN